MNNTTIYDALVVENALLIKDTLIISDIHLGYETELNKNGLMLPQIQYEKIIDSLNRIQNKANAQNIIVNGDIKHNFSKIDKQEWSEILDFLDYLSDLFVDIKLIKGNHDNFLDYIVRKKDLTLNDFTTIENFYITHGHKLPENIPENIDTFIIGHEHPSISIRSLQRVENFKAYLEGYYNEYKLIVQPSFMQINIGSDILNQKTISPFIKDVDDFNVYALESSDVYNFGKVKDLLSLNDNCDIKF